MEWFFGWWDKLVQSVFWQSLTSNFQWVDWFTLIFLLAGIVYGLKNGVMAEIGEIIEIMIVIFVVHTYFERVSTVLLNYAPPFLKEYYKPASYIILGVFTWVIIGTMVRILKKLVHTQTAPLLRYAGGMVLGGLHLLIIWSFISQAILLFNLPTANKVYHEGGSYSGYFISQIAPDIYKMFARPAGLLNPK